MKSTKTAFATIGLGITSLAAIVLVHLLKTDHDPSWRAISEYALGEFGWIMTLAFLAWGIAGVTLFVALRKHIRTIPGKIGLGLLLLGTTGPLLAGIFPTDPYTTSSDSLTPSGMIHSMAVVLCDFIPIAGLILTVSLLRKNPAWSVVRNLMIVATVFAWVGFIVVSYAMMTILPEHGGKLGPDVEIGWHNRLMVISYITWVMAAAWATIKVASIQNKRG